MTRTRLILHITPRSHWQEAQQSGIYQADSLATEGFIHCSKPGQVVRVANTFFRGQRDLLLLCIDPDKLQAELRYDDVAGEPFPHLYGTLNLDAVTQVLKFEPGSDGRFTLPATLQPLLDE